MELPMFYNEADEWNQAHVMYDAALKGSKYKDRDIKQRV